MEAFFDINRIYLSICRPRVKLLYLQFWSKIFYFRKRVLFACFMQCLVILINKINKNWICGVTIFLKNCNSIFQIVSPDILLDLVLYLQYFWRYNTRVAIVSPNTYYVLLLKIFLCMKHESIVAFFNYLSRNH